MTSADGQAALARGDWAEAVRHFEHRLMSGTADSPMLMSLAHARTELGQRAAAIAALKGAIALAPSFGAAVHALAVLLFGDDAFAMSAAIAYRAVAIEPANDLWRNTLGAALIDADRPDEAIAALAAAVALSPHQEKAMTNLGAAFAQAHRYADASRMQERNLLRLFGPVSATGEAVPCNALKLRHDIEQLSYLLAREAAPIGAAAAIDRYRAIIDETQASGVAQKTFHIEISKLGGTALGRILYRRPPGRVGTSAIAPSWDRDRVARQFSVPPGICWIDGLLRPEALVALRKFCLESTIWHDISHNFQDAPTPRGYLGAYPATGFTAPLLHQIAEELTEALPGVFGGRSLRHMWAYKYEAALEGIDIHGDDAAVNVNFWITPDEANLDPATGGLVVYPVEAPADWRFADINNDQSRIRRFLGDSKVEPVNVPYRQNRAVIFNSDLFHATARTRFKPGYENRRINVTMLFGRRHG